MSINMPCADKGRCGTYSHNLGTAYEARCISRARQRALRGGEDDLPMLSRALFKQLKSNPFFAESLDEGASVIGPVEIRGSHANANNVHARMSMKVLDGGFAMGCHTEGNLIVSGKDSIVADCTADGIIEVRGAARVAVTAPGQTLVLIPRAEERDENDKPAGDSVNPDENTVRYPVETTFVYRTWERHGYDPGYNLWSTFVDPWREFAALPKDDPLWVDVRNETLRHWVRDANGINPETSEIDRDLLAIGLQMYQNPA